jgi:hypothetical protein
MIKYLRSITDRLTAFISGVGKFTARWTSHNITAADIQAKIDQAAAMEKAVEEQKQLLADKQTEARALQDELEIYLDQLENFARAIHAKDMDSLQDYGLDAQTSSASRPAPTAKLLVTLEDDTDGVGFIVSTNKDTNASMYEWYKGAGTDASKTDVIPAMALFKTTQKTSFVDDDVVKGQRTFYKVRSVNAAGAGPWSEPVSRVQ